MPNLELAGVAKFEVTVDEIIQLTEALLKESRQARVKLALRRMVDEVQKGNKELVREVLEPLYALSDQESFDRKFPALRARFKAKMLDGTAVISKINCWRVSQQLEAMRRSREWRRSIPWLGRNLTRLELLVDNWIADDAYMYQTDQEMFQAINKYLDEVEVLRQRSRTRAYKRLREGLTGFEANWNRVRDGFDKLTLLHDQL